MKKGWIVLLCVTAIIVGLLVLVYPHKQLNNTSESASSNILNYSTSNAPSSQENSGIITMASKSSVYTVKEYKGHIGVFYNDEGTPYQEIEVEVSSLPEADRKLLKVGIRVTDTDRLNSIIEDYES